MDGTMCTRKDFGVLRNNKVSYFDYAATTFMPDRVDVYKRQEWDKRDREIHDLPIV